MTVPGVGPVVALDLVALVDDPSRFRRAENVGAFLGLTPRRYQSGETDWCDRISKCGAGSMRSFLFEVATTLTGRVQEFSALKSWAAHRADHLTPLGAENVCPSGTVRPILASG